MSTAHFGWAWIRVALLKLVAVLLFLGTLGSPVITAHAQSGPRPEEAAGKVRVEVMVVHATHSGRVDPRLRNLQRQLDHTRYTGFEVISTSSDSLSPGQLSVVSVAGGRKVKIRLIERNNQQARVRIELYKGNEKKLDTTVSIPRNRTFLVAGPKFEGGVLIFPITVTY
ncbi:MAG TPA: hypothetical protein ENK18_03115 [Deltaproteobacteria bacterium]|nr:hypothetical protein [Deltaproteobacteria bacterium]